MKKHGEYYFQLKYWSQTLTLSPRYISVTEFHGSEINRGNICQLISKFLTLVSLQLIKGSWSAIHYLGAYAVTVTTMATCVNKHL